MEIEEAALKKENDELSQEPSDGAAQGAGRAARQVQRHEGPVGKREECHRQGPAAARARSKSSTREIEHAQSRAMTSKRPPELKYGELPELKKQLARGRGAGAERQAEQPAARQGHRGGDRRASSSAGPASRSQSSSRASAKSSCIWTSMLHKRVVGQDEAVTHASRRPSSAPAPAFRTRTARSARSCSSARRASARPSSPRRWQRRCLTMRRTSSASI